MAYRTIMIFPDFINMDVIESIRMKYDPLAKLVRPHITIVFPFELDMSNDEIACILENHVEKLSPFEVKFKGFSKCVNKFGNSLLLNMVEGREQIIQLHDALYGNEFNLLDSGFPYEPHITVGNLTTVEELENAYEDVKDIDCCFTSLITKISVEMIGENEESIIIIEKNLE